MQRDRNQHSPIKILCWLIENAEDALIDMKCISEDITFCNQTPY